MSGCSGRGAYRCFVTDDDLAGLGDAAEHSLLVPGQQGAQVDELAGDS